MLLDTIQPPLPCTLSWNTHSHHVKRRIHHQKFAISSVCNCYLKRTFLTPFVRAFVLVRQLLWQIRCSLTKLYQLRGYRSWKELIRLCTINRKGQDRKWQMFISFITYQRTKIHRDTPVTHRDFKHRKRPTGTAVAEFWKLLRTYCHETSWVDQLLRVGV
jgi:hypothetical protein